MSKEGETMKKENKSGGGIGGRAKVSANVTLTLTGADGKVKHEEHIKNLMVTVGLNEAIKTILGDTGSQPAALNYVAIGTDNTTPVVGDTLLQAEVGTRVQDTTPDFPSTGLGRLISIFGAGNGTSTVRESGVFNTSATDTGTLLARTTFSDIVKGASDSLQVTWEFTLS